MKNSKIDSLRFFVVLYLAITICPSSILAGRIQVVDDKSAYLTYRYLEDVSHKIPPTVKFYPNKDFTGKPTITINPEGLTVEDKLVCKWDHQYREQTDMRSLLVLGPSGITRSPCDKVGPVISQYELFRIEVKNNVSNDYYEVDYLDRTLYLDKKQMTDFDFHESKVTQEKEEKAYQATVYKNLLRDDKSLNDFIIKINQCIKKKDKSCLASNEHYENVLLGWQDYVCGFHKYVVVDEVYYCEKWMKYRCAESKSLTRFGGCDDILKSTQGPKPKLKRQTEKNITNFIWNSLEKCFSKDNSKNQEFKVESTSFSTTIKIKTNEMYDFTCSISKIHDNSAKESKWDLAGFWANPGGHPETEFTW